MWIDNKIQLIKGNLKVNLKLNFLSELYSVQMANTKIHGVSVASFFLLISSYWVLRDCKRNFKWPSSDVMWNISSFEKVTLWIGIPSFNRGSRQMTFTVPLTLYRREGGGRLTPPLVFYPSTIIFDTITVKFRDF